MLSPFSSTHDPKSDLDQAYETILNALKPSTSSVSPASMQGKQVAFETAVAEHIFDTLRLTKLPKDFGGDKVLAGEKAEKLATSFMRGFADQWWPDRARKRDWKVKFALWEFVVALFRMKASRRGSNEAPERESRRAGQWPARDVDEGVQSSTTVKPGSPGREFQLRIELPQPEVSGEDDAWAYMRDSLPPIEETQVRYSSSEYIEPGPQHQAELDALRQEFGQPSAEGRRMRCNAILYDFGEDEDPECRYVRCMESFDNEVEGLVHIRIAHGRGDAEMLRTELSYLE